MALATYKEFTVHAYSDGTLTETTLPFSTEYAVLLKINGLEYITMASSGNYLAQHITGYLLTEGIITRTGEIQSMDIDEESLTVNVGLVPESRVTERLEMVKSLTAAGGRTKRILPDGGLARSRLPVVRAEVVVGVMNEFLGFSQEHKTTHGVHGAALYSVSGERIVFSDDIGRHNAMDKVIGHAALNDMSLEDKMICSTGRISSEIAFKIITAGAPILISRASPTTLGVELLRRYNILSIIRAVGGRFYVINGKDNILY